MPWTKAYPLLRFDVLCNLIAFKILGSTWIAESRTWNHIINNLVPEY